MATSVTRLCAATPEQVWAAVTDFAAHGSVIPWTTVSVDPGEPRPGWGFVARSGPGGVLVDRMVLTAWEPPHTCRILKLGPVLTGWAQLTVTPEGGGARVTWVEEIDAAIAGGLGARLARRPSDALTTRMLDLALDGLLAPLQESE